MVFSSITFLFFFLPLVLLFYSVAGGRLRNCFLLAASLFFYSWGEGIYLTVMLVSIAVNYLCGRLLGTCNGLSSSKKILALGLCLNLGMLGYFKYAAFFTESLNILLTGCGLAAIELHPIHLPIGISFFTFQAMSYLVDVYRKETEPQTSLLNFGLYISLFPQLIAGPIVRYRDIARELVHRRVSLPDFASGIERFLFGLSKKILLANPLAEVADRIFSLPATELTLPVAWFGALCYTFQIYFDFSGYSDMAIGLGRMFGFRFPENFNYPYISRSFREFWRRWHITLSSWLKDYLYIPLGGSRKGGLRTKLNLMSVFLLCGLWHGASWTFLAWGLYHGLFLSLERMPRFASLRERLWPPLQLLSTFLLVVIGWVLFRSETLTGAALYIASMFDLSSVVSGIGELATMLDSKITLEITMAAVLSVPLFPTVRRLQDMFLVGTAPRYAIGSYMVQLALLCSLAYFTVISLAAGIYNPFIYFRF